MKTSSKKKAMTSPEDREKRRKRLNRNDAARSLRNFKPVRIENKKKRQRYEYIDDESEGHIGEYDE